MHSTLLFSLLSIIPGSFAYIHLALTPNSPPFISTPVVYPQDILKQLETLPSAFKGPVPHSRRFRNNRVVHLSTSTNDVCNSQYWTFESILGGIKTKISVDLFSTNKVPDEKLLILQGSESTKWKHGLSHENIEDVKEGCVKGTTELELGGKQESLRVLKCTANMASYEAVLPSCIITTPSALLDLHTQQDVYSVFFHPHRPFGVLSLGGPLLNDNLDYYTWISTSHLPSSSSSSGIPVMITEVKVGRFTKLLEYRPAVLLSTFPFVYVPSSFDLERLYSTVSGAVKLSELYSEYYVLQDKGWNVWGVPCWEGQKVELKFGGRLKEVDVRGPRVRIGGGVCLGIFVGKQEGGDQQSDRVTVAVGQWVLGWPVMRDAEWVVDIKNERLGFFRAEDYKETDSNNKSA